MNKLLGAVFVFFLIVIFSLPQVFSSGNVCCYDNGDLFPVQGKFCENLGGISLDFKSQCGYDRKSFEDPSGTIYTTIGGNKIYDHEDIIRYIEQRENIELEGNLIPYDEGAPGQEIESDKETETPPETGEDSTSIDSIDQEGTIGIDYTQELSSRCSDQGGFGGFFTSQQACENTIVNQNIDEGACLYNPHRGGIFSTNLAYSPEESLVSMETPACVSKREIRTCSDYKTQQNCEDNRAYSDSPDSEFSSTSSSLQDGCSWIQASQYSSGVYEEAEGMCISNSYSDKKDFKGSGAYDRLNIITNPVFSDNLDGWETEGEYSQISYDGRGAVKLEGGQSLIQKIGNVTNSLPYTTSLSVKFLEEGEAPSIQFNYYNENDEEISSSTVFLQTGISEFQNIQYSPLTLGPNVDYIKIEIQTNSDVILDTISLAHPPGEEALIRNGVFYPVQLYHPDSSRCDECYDPYGLNLCTEDKSDILGDCSYMIEEIGEKYISSVDSYTGKEENPYLDNPWEHQSIPSSKVFCELYVTENTCTDEDNFVNSKYSPLHPQSGSTLCKWNEDLGCFKDSNNNDLPDVLNGLSANKNITYRSENPYKSYNDEILFYVHESDEQGEYISDFKRVCDSIPPTANIHLKTINSSGEPIIIEEGKKEGLIGGVMISLRVSSFFPKQYSCAPFNDVEEEVFLEIESNEKTLVKRISLDQKGLGDRLIDYRDIFSNLDEKQEVTFRVFDQSGNFGLVQTFEFEADFTPPRIEAINPSATFSAGFEQNSIVENSFEFNQRINNEDEFEFEISDKGGIKMCLYKFGGDDIITNTSENEIDFEGEKNKKISLNPNNYIDFEQKSLSGDPVSISFECEDIFGQKSKYYFNGETLADILVVSPRPIPFNKEEYEENDIEFAFEGFYNQQELPVEIYTNRNDITSCSLDDSTLYKPQEGEFEVKGENFSLKLNGTVELDDQQGEQDLSLECEVQEGSGELDTITLFYDSQEPELQELNLVNQEGVFYDEQNQMWYTINEPRDVDIEVTLNGVHSWINRNYSLFDLNGEIIGENYPTNYIGINYRNSSLQDAHDFTSIAKIVDLPINPQDKLPNGSINVFGDDSLLHYRFDLEFEDKAGNKNRDEIEFQFDRSDPIIEFGGDIITQDSQNGYLYTREIDPKIEVTFNSHEYRKFSCTAIVQDDVLEYRAAGNSLFSQVSNTSFNLANIVDGSNVDVSQIKYTVELHCDDDAYPEQGSPRLSGEEFTIIHDDTKPEINSFSVSPEQSYFRNSQNIDLNSLSATLDFEFEDTGEVQYICEYQVESIGGYYNCESQIQSSGVLDNSLQQSIETNLLLPYDVEKERTQTDDDYLCYQRTNEFWNEANSKRNSEEIFETEIEISAQCEDVVGLKTNTYTTKITNTYSPSRISDVSYENLQNGNVEPTIIAITSNMVDFSYKFKDYQGNTLLNSKPSDANPIGDGLYQLDFSGRQLDTSQLSEGENTIYVEAYSGGILHSIRTILNLDRTPPKVNLSIIDSFDNESFSQEFAVDMRVDDRESVDPNVDEVILEINGQEVYSSSATRTSNFNFQDTMITRDSGGVYEGRYYFRGNVDETYEFNVTAYDGAGNKNNDVKTIQIQEGARLDLLDSDSALVGVDPFIWLTRDDEPVLDGVFNRDMTCSVYPYKENSQFSQNSEEHESFPNTDSFSLDMNDFEDFDFSQLENNRGIIHIECDRDGEILKFNREVIQITGLPDYTLESSNGFYLNGITETEFMINSVGAFQEVSCQLEHNEEITELGEGTTFNTPYEFSAQSSPEQSVILTCEDPFEVEGPEKEFEFIVIDDEPTIESVSLETENSRQTKSEGETFYVDSSSVYELYIELDRVDVTCDYSIAGDNFLSNAIHFYNNLVSLGSANIFETGNPFIYSTGGIQVTSDSEMKISCDNTDKTFNITVIEDDSASIILS